MTDVGVVHHMSSPAATPARTSTGVRAPGRLRLRRPARAGGPEGRVPGRRRPPHRWRVLLWRARFPFAAVLLGAAVVLALADLRPPAPPSRPVVVAARLLVAGAVLTPEDLTVAHLPPGAVADGSHERTDALVGRAPVVAVPAGLPVVDALLGDDRLAAAGPPGTVVVPVRLADPGVAELLRPGDHVDLFAAATSATGEPAARRLAQRALVLPLPAASTRAAAPGLLGGAPVEGGTITLVAVAPEQAAALAGASAWDGLSAVAVR